MSATSQANENVGADKPQPALIDFIGERRWCAWRNEMQPGADRPTKVPYYAPDRRASHSDPSTWMPHDEAVAVAPAIDTGLGGGIGYFLGPHGDRCDIGIDLDTCRDPITGVIASWALAVIERFGSYTEVSPSECGTKITAQVLLSDLPTLRKMMGTEHGRQFKRTNGVAHPPAIELHVSNRYFAVTWQGLPDTPDELRLLPLSDLEWLVKEAGPALAGKSPRGGGDGSRSAIAYRMCIQCVREGKTYEEFCEAVRTHSDTAAWFTEKGEPNDQRELHRIWEKVSNSVAQCDPTEDAVATEFAETYAKRLAYDHTEETWFVWQYKRWTRDTRNRGFHAARVFTRAIKSKLDDPPKSLAKIAFCAAVERAARADPMLAVSQEVWNADPWLLGTPGGIIDLRTGAISEATPGHYISRYTSVAPAPPGTPAPEWQKFLNAATKNDGDFQGFLQRLSGYVLTGDVSEEVVTFFYGPGGNGKGTFLTALIGILGDYATAVPIEAFTAGARINLEYYRAQMAGARLITASETEAQATWAEAQIKEITGNDTPISGRHPRGRPFTFRVQAKIIIVGNHAPKLKGRSPAMERRLRVAPFANTPTHPDLGLKEKLKPEYPAILRWMLDGCVVWQDQRLGTAKVVAKATTSYFEQQDAFGRWLEERCIQDKSLSLKPGMLLANFNAWAKANGEDTATNNAFAEMIDRVSGLTRTRTHGVRYVQGIGLKAPPPPPDPEDADEPC